METIVAATRTIAAPPPVMVEVSAMTRQRLDELDRLRGIGMARAMELDGAGSPSNVLSPEQHFRLRVRNAAAFDRIGRAVRQIMTLEFELLGLFEAPDRDAFPKPRKIKPGLAGILARPRSDIGRIKPIDLSDLKLRPDYRNGPMEDVVAGIRKTLGAEAPTNDPFAPPLEVDEGGYFKPQPGSQVQTNIPGIYVAGDCSDHVYRQAITAAGMGCAAAIEAERCLAEHGG